MEKKEMKRCPYCGEMILAAAKKCKYCGEWLENSEAIIADDKEEKLATVVPKSKSKPVAEPAPEPEDATTDGDDEVVDTGYGVSVSKKLAKRITWGLVAVAIVALLSWGMKCLVSIVANSPCQGWMAAGKKLLWMVVWNVLIISIKMEILMRLQL